MKNIIKIASAACILALAGCAKETAAPDNVITIKANIGAMTRVQYDGNATSFTSGDKISLYAWTGDASAVSADKVVDGIENTYDGAKWVPASTMTWASMTEPHYFIGVYPARTVTDFAADPFTLDVTGDNSNDLLFAANLDGLKAAAKVVPLSFNHAMAKVNINLNFRNQWDAAPTVTQVAVEAKSTATIDYVGQTVTATGNSTGVNVPETTPVAGFKLSYTGLQIPQDGVKKIIVTVEGRNYVYESTDDIPLVSGKFTSINLTVGKDKMEAGTITVSDWEAGGVISAGDAERQPLSYNLDATTVSAGASVKNLWSDGDEIFVFLSGIAAPKHLKMTYNGAAWNTVEMDGASECPGHFDLVNGDTGTMTAVYIPGSNNTVAASGSDFTFTKVPEYFLISKLDYSVSRGKIDATFDMILPEGFVQFFVSDGTGAQGRDIELREPHLTPKSLVSVSADGSFKTSSLAHGAPVKGVAQFYSGKRGFVFTGVLSDDARNHATDYHYTVVADGWNGSYYDYSSTRMILYTSPESGRANALPALENWNSSAYKPIDLGLEMPAGTGSEKKRVYLSSRNLGALRDTPAALGTLESRQETWGDYFGWADTSPYYENHFTSSPTIEWKNDKQEGYMWDSYCFGSSATSLTKYCGNEALGEAGFHDTLTEIEAWDDAANRNLGRNWRTATIFEWAELVNSPDYSWNWDNYRRGYILTSNKIGFDDGRYVFIPAAGGWGSVYHVSPDVTGNYWTSTLYTPMSSSAYYVDLSPDRGVSTSFAFRCYGFSIRPVTD